MIRSIRLTLVMLTGLATITVAVAQTNPQALDILKRTIMAEGSVNFSGVRSVVVFESGVKIHGYQQQVYEKAPGKLRMTVIAPEAQRGRLCVSDGRIFWEYLPGKYRVTRREVPPLEHARARRLADLERLTARMRVEYLGTETIAGRTTHVVKVIAGSGSPLKKIWADAAHYVPLKMQRFDPEGRVKLSMYYTSINFQPQYTAGMFDFKPPADCVVRAGGNLPERITLGEAEARAGFKAALPRYLPAGYNFQNNRVAVIPLKGQKVLWMTFSNGADTFSIFQRRHGVALAPRQSGRSMDWAAGKFSFTLVGQLGCEEMRKVRESVKP